MRLERLFTEELIRHLDVNNHELRFDGAEYTWYFKDGKSWRVFNINSKEDPKVLASWIHWYRSTVKKELHRRLGSKKDVLDSVIDSQRLYQTIENTVGTKNKVRKLKELRPTYSHKDIAKYLDVSVKTVQRNLK